MTKNSVWRSLTVAVCAAALLASPDAAASASSTPTPPFSECPAIGVSPRCEILLVINPNQSISVLGDSSVGPYDGSDDTLVGVLNNTNSPIPAVTVSGPGSGLAGFDGDGICTYASGGINGSGFNGDSYCTPQQLSGVDPEDYAGPGTSFTLDPSSQDDVEVDFSGSGLVSGASTYFSLEGALTAAVVTARKGGLDLTYVALGDSYSSGEGLPPYQTGTSTSQNHCHRSLFDAYPDFLLDSVLSSQTLVDRACSGATISDLYNGFSANHENSQLNHLTAQTDVVTIGVGGDDVGFSKVLGWCITGIKTNGSDNCQYRRVQDATDPSRSVSLNTREDELIRGLGQDQYCGKKNLCKPSLRQLYGLIGKKSPNAHIYVLLYPHMFTNAPGRFGCVLAGAGIGRLALYRISKANMQWINTGIDLLDQEITDEVARAQVAGVDVSVVDPRSLFNATAGGNTPGGHGVCTKQPWVNGLHLRVGWPPYTSGSFHPNGLGQKAFADAIAAAIK